MNLITSQVVREASRWLHVREVGRNDGPEIRGWLARVHRKPGRAWCAAFAWCVLDDAIAALGARNPLPPTAGVHLFAARAKALGAWTSEPGEGFIFFADHGRDSAGNRIGHCGVVVGVDAFPYLATIEGNTNESGGREGDRVARKTRAHAYASLGYLDPGLLLVEAERVQEHAAP